MRYVEAMKKTLPFSIRLDADLKAELQRLAQADRRSLTNLVEIILEDYVAANSRKGKAA